MSITTYLMYSKKSTKKMFLNVSYIFPKFESSKKYEGVIFLVIPPSHTFTHLCLLLVGTWLPLLLVFDLE